MTKISNNKGFTLIELLAIIVVISIILTISVPLITNSISNSREKILQTNANSVAKEYESRILLAISDELSIEELQLYNIDFPYNPKWHEWDPKNPCLPYDPKYNNTVSTIGDDAIVCAVSFCITENLANDLGIDKNSIEINNDLAKCSTVQILYNGKVSISLIGKGDFKGIKVRSK